MMPLCQACQRFNIQSFKENAGGSRGLGIPISVVLDGWRNGCHFCTILNDAFNLSTSTRGKYLEMTPDFGKRNKGESDDGMRLIGWRVTPVHGALGTIWNRSKSSFPFVSKRFYACADPGSPAAVSHDIAGSGPIDYPGHEDFYAHVQKWLLTCRKEHGSCGITISGRALDFERLPLPSRCVRIVTIDGNISGYLEETRGIDGSYVALSHRWNDLTILSKTLRSNYMARIGGECLDLPPVFKDALLVAHRLGINYIWIDSLCIIQEDLEDWKEESKKMAAYYQNAFVTFSATVDATVTGLSLSEPSNRALPKLARLPYLTASKEEKGWLYAYEEPKPVIEMWTRADLLTRGWVFQERLLSRRTIYFGANIPGRRLLCVCQDTKPTNEWGIHIPASGQDFWMSLALKTFDKESNARDVLTHWLHIVYIFSKLDLTFPETDRVSALAGVATEIRSAMRSIATPISRLERTYIDSSRWTQRLDAHDRFFDAYIAGLWVADMPFALLWQGLAGKKLSGYPTWSWASSLSQVSWLPHQLSDKQSLCTLSAIISGQTIHNISSGAANPNTGPTPFDVDTKFATLQFRGQHLSLSVHGALPSEHWAHVPTMPLYQIREKLNLRGISHSSNPLEICGWASFEHPDFQTDETAHMKQFSDVDAFPVAKALAFKGRENHDDVFDVALDLLLLRKVTDIKSLIRAKKIPGNLPSSDAEYYERIGIARVMEHPFLGDLKATKETEFRLV